MSGSKGRSGAPRNQDSVEKTEQPADRAGVTPEQVWIALAHGFHTMSSAIERSFAGNGMSLTDFMLLEALLHKGSMTITEIQAVVLLASGSMTAAVDRLESRGLIARTLSRKDRRARVLELTEEGTATITVAYDQHSEDLKHWMKVLSAEERASTFASLRKLEKHLKAMERHAPQ